MALTPVGRTEKKVHALYVMSGQYNLSVKMTRDEVEALDHNAAWFGLSRSAFIRLVTTTPERFMDGLPKYTRDRIVRKQRLLEEAKTK